MKQQKAVAPPVRPTSVELGDTLFREAEEPVILGVGLGLVIGEIGDQREMKVLVGVGERSNLEVGEQAADPGLPREQGRDGDESPVLGGNPLGKIASSGESVGLKGLWQVAERVK